MPKYYTPEEVAQELRVTLRSVYEWLKSGRLRGVRAGNRWRIRPEDVEAFVQQGGNGGAVVTSDEVAKRGGAVAAPEAAEERAARIRAGRGILAHTSVTVDDLLRWKRKDVERENRRLESREG